MTALKRIRPTGTAMIPTGTACITTGCWVRLRAAGRQSNAQVVWQVGQWYFVYTKPIDVVPSH